MFQRVASVVRKMQLSVKAFFRTDGRRKKKEQSEAGFEESFNTRNRMLARRACYISTASLILSLLALLLSLIRLMLWLNT